LGKAYTYLRMEALVKAPRAKQKHYAKGRKDQDEKPSEHARRVFVSTSNKRAIARFAKGPSDKGGFTYPRRRVSVPKIEELEIPFVTLIESELPSIAVSVENFEPIRELVIVEQAVDNIAPVSESPPVSEFPESDERHDNEEAQIVASKEEIEDQLEEVSKKIEECRTTATMSKKMDAEELPDDTIGPGDRSSESESSAEESDVEAVKPAPIVPVQIIKTVPKPASVRKISPVTRKVASVVPTPARSSWSKFLPLVIEIKATIPYPMHLLGFGLLLVTGLLLRLLYQFGADLGGEVELQVQMIRLAKLAFLFVVVAMCVNFVEDNKELHKDPAPAQPKLRPSKVSKNKKKMMLKV